MNIHITCRTNVSSEIVKVKSTYELQIPDKLKDVPGAVSVTKDPWSLQIYSWYLAVTLNWIDKSWVLRNVLLDFIRFQTAHNARTTSQVLMDVLIKWGILFNLKEMTTGNVSDMCAAMEIISRQLNAQNSIE